jgi:hypothetical protein
MHYAIVQQIENVGQKCNTRWYIVTEREHVQLNIYRKNIRLHYPASDKVYQLLAHGLWFPPGTPASSITNTGRHDIAEILLKVVLSIKNQLINLYVTKSNSDTQVKMFDLVT